MESLHALEWSNPMFKQKRRPYLIQRDVSILEKKQCVTKVLQSERFREHLEGVLKGHLDGSGGRKLKSLRKLQENVIPASQIEAAHQTLQGAAVGVGVAPHIIPINDLRGALADKYTLAECQARCKLASLYRVINKMGLTQMIFNHISLRVPGEKEHFLINPFGLHYSEVTAANLVKIDLAGNIVDPGTTQLGVNKAGYVIHSAIHEGRKDIKCIVHLHSQYGAAISAMKCGLLPISQEALLIGEVSYHPYRGIVCDEAEKAEIVRDLGPVNQNMLLYNHGLLAMGKSVEEAYTNCYFFVRACEIQVSALSVGLSNLIGVDKDICRKVVSVGSKSGGGVSRHGNMQRGDLEYEAEMRALDREGYNTGYPYKYMHLLVPGSDAGQVSEPEEPKLQRKGSERGRERDKDMQHIVKRIREERKRIQRERAQKHHGGQPPGSTMRTPSKGTETSSNTVPHFSGSHYNEDRSTPGSHGNRIDEGSDTQKSSLWSFLDERNASNLSQKSPKINKPSGGRPNGVHTPPTRAKITAPVPADSAYRPIKAPHASSPLVTHTYQPVSSAPHLSLQSHASPQLVQSRRKAPEIIVTSSNKLASSPVASKSHLPKSTQPVASSSSSTSSLHSGSYRGSNVNNTHENGGLGLSALDRARTIAEVVAHSTGQSVERLAYHKDQIESHHHQQKKQRRRARKKDKSSQGLHSSSSSSISSSGDNLRQRSDTQSSYSSQHNSLRPSGEQPPNEQQLFGLDKVMHTAEQVAESTGASLQKLGQSRDLNE